MSGSTQSFPLQGGLTAPFAVGLGLVIAIEGVVLHLWIASRSRAWAWAIAALNVATIVWLWREYKAGTDARLVVGGEEIDIDAGSRLRCHFPRALIETAEQATWRSVPGDLAPGWANTARPLEPNVVITLREPVSGRIAIMTKSITKIGLRVHDAEAVCSTLAGSRGLTP